MKVVFKFLAVERGCAYTDSSKTSQFPPPPCPFALIFLCEWVVGGVYDNIKIQSYSVDESLLKVTV